MTIIPGSNYGDIRKQASEDPHGLTPQTIDALGDRMEKFLPRLASSEGTVSRQFFDGLLPEGAELDPRTHKKANLPSGAMLNGMNFGGTYGGSTYMTNMRPYQPEFESPDRQMYPVHRILANRYWRLFYKLDPTIGTCIEMISEMPWSDFQLTGEGVSGEIKEAFESMCEETQILKTLQYMVKEFLVIGEACPHNFFDESKGIWTYTALHNPDQLEVIDAPFIKMDPVVEFIPDDRLRSVLTSNNRLLRRVREQMPPELISRLIARQNIPLSPINMTFIPRRLHPYDTRGTSIISRMWRILMYEDAIFNASIATARRHAGPIKVAKLGNPQTGWIPSQEHEKRLLQLLAQAELDVNSWLVYHYGINFEMVGTTDRIMNITQHNEVIERIKLVALGISKAFLTGEVTYSSSVTGLTVFLQRLLSIRNFFVTTWLLPKFFKPIAKINGWAKRDKGELNHRYRIKRSQRELELENRWIVPKVEWQKTLDHSTNSELITAMTALEQLGIKFSKTTKYASVGKKFEDEINKIAEEQVLENSLKQYVDTTPPPTEGGPKSGGMPKLPPSPPGGGGGPPKMPAPGGDAGVRPTPPRTPGGAADITPPDGMMGSSDSDKNAEGGGTGPSGKKDPAVRDLNPEDWDHKGRHGNWSASEVQDLITLLFEGSTDSAFWDELKGEKLSKALDSAEPLEVLDVIETFLEERGYPPSDIRELRKILDKEGALKNIQNGDTAKLKRVEKKMPDDTGMLDDETMMNRLSSYIDDDRPQATKLANPTAIYTGYGNGEGNWNGDISGLIGDEK